MTLPMMKITEIFEEYGENDSIFSKEDELTRKVKRIVWNKLDENERTILLLYSEVGNMRDTAKLLKVSTSTICIYISRIRKKIKDELDK